MDTWNIVLAIIASVLTILAVIVNAITGIPFRQLLLIYKHTIVRISRNPDFEIEAVKDKSKNRTLHESSIFSYQFDVPLAIRGQTKLPDTSVVWTILSDDTGGYYLQYPSVNIRLGTWTASNIRPGKGIKSITFYKVDAKANEFFIRKADHGEWGKFKPIPTGCTEIAFIELD